MDFHKPRTFYVASALVLLAVCMLSFGIPPSRTFLGGCSWVETLYRKPRKCNNPFAVAHSIDALIRLSNPCRTFAPCGWALKRVCRKPCKPFRMCVSGECIFSLVDIVSAASIYRRIMLFPLLSHKERKPFVHRLWVRIPRRTFRKCAVPYSSRKENDAFAPSLCFVFDFQRCFMCKRSCVKLTTDLTRACGCDNYGINFAGCSLSSRAPPSRIGCMWSAISAGCMRPALKHSAHNGSRCNCNRASLRHAALL